MKYKSQKWRCIGDQLSGLGKGEIIVEHPEAVKGCPSHDPSDRISEITVEQSV